MKNAISLKNIKKSYGDMTVLDSVSATFSDSIAIMGASGKGKTTLLRIIMGLEKADGGEVSFEVKPRFCTVFQEERLFDGFSAIDNVCAVASKKMPRAEAERRAQELLCALLIDKSEHQKNVGAYSGGMRRRVAIARALFADGNILVLDEPYKGLDPHTREVCASVICKYANDRLILLITHDDREAELTRIGDIFYI